MYGYIRAVIHRVVKPALSGGKGLPPYFYIGIPMPTGFYVGRHSYADRRGFLPLVQVSDLNHLLLTTLMKNHNGKSLILNAQTLFALNQYQSSAFKTYPFM